MAEKPGLEKLVTQEIGMPCGQRVTGPTRLVDDLIKEAVNYPALKGGACESKLG
jgi:hypothetical protein